jgi:hypothetical protein
MDKHGKIHISHVSTDAKRDRPEIDKKVLRKLLLEFVGSEAVHLDWKLNHVSGPREDGRYGLQFMGREEVRLLIWLLRLMELGRWCVSWCRALCRLLFVHYGRASIP